MSNSRLQLMHFRSTRELRALAADWDDLWQRSTTTLPTARAELVAHWLERLAPEKPFHGFAVRDGGRLVAAMPLVETRLKGVVKAARLPCNDWSWAGDLLLDGNAPDDALHCLLDGVLKLGLPVLWFDGVPVSQPHWQRFLGALRERGIDYARRERFAIGLVDLAQEWGGYQSGWSGNFRRQMRKMTRRAEELGGVSLSVHRPTDAVELARLLQLGFEVEDRGWKGQEGTSVLKSPPMHEYLCEQAALLAKLGHLELYFLEFEQKPIAFEYGMSAKRSYFSPKVGYDEAYSHLSPGQLLRLKMSERFFADSTCDTWDFLGPLVEATQRWTTSSYAIERLVMATGGVSGRLALRTYRDWLPAAKRLRERWARANKPQRGATAEAPVSSAAAVAVGESG